MFAVLALICFVVGAVKVGSTDSWAFWVCVGLGFVAVEMILGGLGIGYGRFHRRA